MFYDLKSGENKNEGYNPCVHYADGNIWFNLNVGQVSLSLSSIDYDKLVKALLSADSNQEYIDAFPGKVYLMALEENDENSRNLCIFDGALAIVFNFETKVLIGLGEFLAKEKDEDDFLKPVRLKL